MVSQGLKGVALLADSDFEFKHFMFKRLLKRSGLQESDFFLGTTWQPGLLKELQDKKVKVVVPLGEPALGTILGESDILRWRGRVVEHPQLPGVWVMPLMQPRKLMNERPRPGAYPPPLRHPPRFHGTWMRDIAAALAVAKNGFTRAEVNYLLDPDPLTFARFADEYFEALRLDSDNVWLSWDIETPYKAKHTEDESELEEKENVLDGIILRVSFCFRLGYSVSVIWDSRNEPTIRRLLRSTGGHVVWNGRTFDVPVVETAGYDVLGIIMDFMDGYHLYQSDLPKGLEWVSAEATDVLPWKHLAAAEPAWYNAEDADVALRNALYIKKQLITTGQWELFLNHVVRLMPLLDEAGRHGNLMDPVKREEMRTRLTGMRDEMVAEVQPWVPRELFPRKRYERQPDDFEQNFSPCLAPASAPDTTNLVAWDVIWEPEEVKVCSHCGQVASNKTEHFKGSLGEPNPKTGKPTRVKNPCKEASALIELKPAFVPRFLRLEPWNPNSSQQLMAYMRFHGHPVGKDKKNSSKDTADASHLKVLVKRFGEKFPIYSKTLLIHKMSKTIGTYTPEPDENNILHTQYVNSTSTWRLGARKVKFGTQIQNWGKKDENPFAKEAREQIIARPGHKLVQVDSSAVEAVMQGYFMNDVEYMKLASQSIHAWLACKELGLVFNPENVDRVKSAHERLYLQMKVVNYLTNFGGGPKLMTDTYPEIFPTMESAEAAQNLLYKLLPTLKAFHHAVRWEAHTKTFIETPWGYRHWYYDVFKMKPDGTMGLGKDAKRCVAMKPQNSNAAFQKDNLLLLGYSPIDGKVITDLNVIMKDFTIYERERKNKNTWARFMGTNASIHDSNCLDVINGHVEQAAQAQLAIFTRPIPQMRGLRIGAEVEVGLNWAGRSTKNPNGMEREYKVVVDDYTAATTEAGCALEAAA